LTLFVLGIDLRIDDELLSRYQAVTVTYFDEIDAGSVIGKGYFVVEVGDECFNCFAGKAVDDDLLGGLGKDEVNAVGGGIGKQLQVG
jgi:hypothetical protein